MSLLTKLQTKNKIENNKPRRAFEDDDDATPLATLNAEQQSAAAVNGGVEQHDDDHEPLCIPYSDDSDLEDYYRACQDSDMDDVKKKSRRGGGGGREKVRFANADEDSNSSSSEACCSSDSSGSDYERGLSGGQRTNRNVSNRGRLGYGSAQRGDDDDLGDAAMMMQQQGVSPMRGKPSLSLQTAFRTNAKNNHRKRLRDGVGASDGGGDEDGPRSSKAANPSARGVFGSTFGGLFQRPEELRSATTQKQIERLQGGLLGDPQLLRQPTSSSLSSSHHQQGQLRGSSGEFHNYYTVGGCSVSRQEAPQFLTRELVEHVAHQEPSRLFSLNPATQRWEFYPHTMGLCRALSYHDGVNGLIGRALGAASSSRQLLEGHCASLLLECTATMDKSSYVTSAMLTTAPQQQQRTVPSPATASGAAIASSANAAGALLVEGLASFVLCRFADMCRRIVVGTCRPRVGDDERFLADEADRRRRSGNGAYVVGAPPPPPLPFMKRGADRNGSSSAPSPSQQHTSQTPFFSRPIDLSAWCEDTEETVHALNSLFDKCGLVTTTAAVTAGATTSNTAGAAATTAGAAAKKTSSASPPRSTAKSVSHPQQQRPAVTRAAALLEALLDMLTNAQKTCRPDAMQLYAELFIYSSWPLFEVLGQGVTGTTGLSMASIAVFNRSSSGSVSAASPSFGELFANPAACSSFETLIGAAMGLGPVLGTASRYLASSSGGGGGWSSNDIVGDDTSSLQQQKQFKVRLNGQLASLAELRQLINAARELKTRGIKEKGGRGAEATSGHSPTKSGKVANQAGGETTMSSNNSRLMPTVHDDEGSNWGSNPASARTSGALPFPSSDIKNNVSSVSSTVGTVVGGGRSGGGIGGGDAVAVIGQLPHYFDPQQQEGQRDKKHQHRSRHHTRRDDDDDDDESPTDAMLRQYAGNSYTRSVFTRLREGGTGEMATISQLQAASDNGNKTALSMREWQKNGRRQAECLLTDYVREERDADFHAEALPTTTGSQDEILSLLADCEVGDALTTAGPHRVGLATIRTENGVIRATPSPSTTTLHPCSAVNRSSPSSSSPYCPPQQRINRFLRIVDAPFPSIVISIEHEEEAGLLSQRKARVFSQSPLLLLSSSVTSHQHRRTALSQSSSSSSPSSSLPSRVRIDHTVSAVAWLRSVLIDPLSRIVSEQQMLVVRALLSSAPPPSSPHQQQYFVNVSSVPSVGLFEMINVFRNVCFMSHAAMSEVFLEQLVENKNRTTSALNSTPSSPSLWYKRLSVDEIKSPYQLTSSRAITAAFVEAKASIPHGRCIDLIVLPWVSASGGVVGGTTSSSAARQVMSTFEAMRLHFTVPRGLQFVCPTLSLENSRDNVSVWLALDVSDTYSRVFSLLAMLKYCRARLLQAMKRLFNHAKSVGGAGGAGGGGSLTVVGLGNGQHHSRAIRRNYVLRVVIDIFIDFVMTTVESAAKRYEVTARTSVTSLSELKSAHLTFIQSLRVALLLPPPTEPTASRLTTQLATMREAQQRLLLTALGEVEEGWEGGGSLFSSDQSNPTERIDLIVAEFIAAAQKLPSSTFHGNSLSNFVGSEAYSSAFLTAATAQHHGTTSSHTTDYYNAVKPMLNRLTLNDYFTSVITT